MNNAKTILDKVKSLKSNSDSMALKKTKGTINGALIGMAGGLLLGYTRKYNLVTSAFLGAVLGGIVSQVLLPKTEEE